jgi:tetrahydromethanopterin S-methyltransferase subunit F
MLQLNLQAQHSQLHDVYFTATGSRRFVWRLTNHGITLDDRSLSYSVDGNAQTLAFTDIAAIHLSSAGLGNANRVIDQCKIEFTSGDAITVSNVTSSGLPDNAQTQAYRDFIHDLHGRLIGSGLDKIRFTAGMSSARYKGALATMIIAGLFFVVTPLVLTLVTGDMHALIVMGAGAFFVWPFMRLVSNNTPRNYTPDTLPRELIS